MKIVPAIDLLEKCVVRLVQGDYTKKTVYEKNPLDMLRTFEAAGANWVHIVDLEAARSGIPAHLDVLQELVKKKAVGTVLEWGGGIRDAATLSAVMDCGADRAILGSALVKNPDLLHFALEKYGAGKIIAGVDAKDGLVRISGWEEKSSFQAFVFAAQLEKSGIREIIYTDISRDGTLEGPSLSHFRRMLEETGLDVVASGGVSRYQDLMDLRELSREFPGRLKGAICGKAIYEKQIDLKKAVEILKGF